MGSIETVEVVAIDGTMKVINKSDFVPGKDTLWEERAEQPQEATEGGSEEPSSVESGELEGEQSSDDGGQDNEAK